MKIRQTESKIKLHIAETFSGQYTLKELFLKLLLNHKTNLKR